MSVLQNDFRFEEFSEKPFAYSFDVLDYSNVRFLQTLLNMPVNAEGVPKEYFLRSSGTGASPWETARVQPAIVELVKQGMFAGEVLDIGCGIGDNAVYIASHVKNIHLTAIDLVTFVFSDSK